MRCNSNRACVVSSSSENCRIALLSKPRLRFLHQSFLKYQKRNGNKKNGKRKNDVVINSEKARTVIQQKRKVNRPVVKSLFFSDENLPIKKLKLNWSDNHCGYNRSSYFNKSSTNSLRSQSKSSIKIDELPPEIISKIGFMLPVDSFQMFKSTNSTIYQAMLEHSYYKHLYASYLTSNCLQIDNLTKSELSRLNTALFSCKTNELPLKHHLLTRAKTELSMLKLNYLSTIQPAPKNLNIYGINKVVVTRSALHILTKNKQIFCLQLTRGSQKCSLRNATFQVKKGEEIYDKLYFTPNYFNNDILDFCTANGNSPCTRQYLYILRKGDGRGNVIEIHEDTGNKNFDKKFFVTCSESTKLVEIKVATSNERTSSSDFMNLVVLKTNLGQLFTLAIEESRLSNLGGETEHVTLKLLTNSDHHGKVGKFETRDGTIAVINEDGKLFISCQRIKDLHNIFGKFQTDQNKFKVRNLIPIGKDLKFRNVSVEKKHLVCVDSLDRIFGIGVNNVGQTGCRKGNNRKLRSLTRGMKNFTGFKGSANYRSRVKFVQCGQDCTVFYIENLDQYGSAESCFLVYRGRRESKYCKIMPRVSVNLKQVLLVQDVVFLASSYDAEQLAQ